MSFPDLEAALYSYLTGLSGLTNASTGVSTRIYAGLAPQEDAYPRITFTVPTDQPNHYMAGASGLTEATVQIDVWALSSLSRRSITNLVRNGMDGLIGGTMGTAPYNLSVDSVLLKSKRATEETKVGEENASENAIFRMSMDFSIYYREAIPTLS